LTKYYACRNVDIIGLAVGGGDTAPHSFLRRLVSNELLQGVLLLSENEEDLGSCSQAIRRVTDGRSLPLAWCCLSPVSDLCRLPDPVRELLCADRKMEHDAVQDRATALQPAHARDFLQEACCSELRLAPCPLLSSLSMPIRTVLLLERLSHGTFAGPPPVSHDGIFLCLQRPAPAEYPSPEDPEEKQHVNRRTRELLLRALLWLCEAAERADRIRVV
jgi:hypothetical protein